jgi:hypothetical protein
MSAMPEPTDKPSGTELPSPSGGDPKASRRRLLQGGLAAAPVLMTLVSRPVLAVQCTTPSGYVSLNASTAGRGVNCTGHTPAYWANPVNFSQWPPGFIPQVPPGPLTRFNAQFEPDLPMNPTLLAVLGFTGSPTNDVARYVSAALLNAAAGLTPVLSAQTVKHIWSEFATVGHFSPSSGASWNASEIIEYLLTTMQS